MDNKIKAALLGIIIVVAALPLLMRAAQGPVQAGVEVPVQAGIQSSTGATSEKPAGGAEWTRAFAVDPDLIGAWTVVDFVRTIDDFQPGKNGWTGGFAFERLVFNDDGFTSGPWQWTKGYMWHPGDRAEGAYVMKDIGGSKYLFMEWISGDVLIRGEKPRYYVLAREQAQ